MTIKKIAIILVHALIGWVLCDATIVIGMKLTSMQNILIIHAILAPVFFIFVSVVYFTRFNFTRPLPTALTFVGFVMIVDFLLVALVINRSLVMFTSLLGTWIPFALIFASTFLTGQAIKISYTTNKPSGMG